MRTPNTNVQLVGAAGAANKQHAAARRNSAKHSKRKVSRYTNTSPPLSTRAPSCCNEPKFHGWLGRGRGAGTWTPVTRTKRPFSAGASLHREGHICCPAPSILYMCDACGLAGEDEDCEFSAVYTGDPTLTRVCGPSEDLRPEHNFCFRDDIAVKTEKRKLVISSGGCPDHRVFHTLQYISNSSSSCSSGCCSSSSCSSGCSSGDCSSGDCCAGGDDGCCDDDRSISSVYPRFHSYMISVPSRPALDASGPTWLTESLDDAVHGDPVGVAVNGVLIFANHSKTGSGGEIINMGMNMKIDSCSGHSDRGFRYHYHTTPLCILEAMGQTVPSTGAAYLFEGSPLAQASMWQSRSLPSPLLGVAMDGFPIFGPYNASGHLQLGSSAGAQATLSECNFDMANRRYHFTPNPPYSPPCLHGVKGEYHDELMAPMCPRKGTTNAYVSFSRLCHLF